MLQGKTFDKIIILVIITILFYVGILIFSDVDTIINKIFQIKLEFLPIIFGLMGIQFFCLGIKYHRLLQKLSINLPIKESVKIYIAGLSLIATPGGVGTAIKSHILKKKFDKPFSLTLPIIFIERLTELLTILILLSIFLIWSQLYESLIAIGLGYIFVIVMYIISSNTKIFLSFKNLILKINKIKKFTKTLDESRDSLSKLMESKTLCESIAWSIPAKIAQCIAVYFVFLSLGMDLGLILSSQIYHTSLVLGSLTFIPSGLIVTESSMLALLLNNKIELSLATLAIIFTRMITTGLVTVLGIISLKSIGLSPKDFKNKIS